MRRSDLREAAVEMDDMAASGPLMKVINVLRDDRYVVIFL